MTPEQEREFTRDFRKCLPDILEGLDPAMKYRDGWLKTKQFKLGQPDLLSMGYVLGCVASATGFSMQRLKSDRRFAELVRARQLAYLLLDRYCEGQSITKIAEFMQRDPTTLLHGVRRAKDLLKSNRRVAIWQSRAVKEIMR